jgi:hypothetical protein
MVVSLSAVRWTKPQPATRLNSVCAASSAVHAVIGSAPSPLPPRSPAAAAAPGRTRPCVQNRLVIASQRVSKPLTLAGKLQPRRLNN